MDFPEKPRYGVVIGGYTHPLNFRLKRKWSVLCIVFSTTVVEKAMVLSYFHATSRFKTLKLLFGMVALRIPIVLP